jgi:hypothetical protein
MFYYIDILLRQLRLFCIGFDRNNVDFGRAGGMRLHKLEDIFDRKKYIMAYFVSLDI